MSWQDYPEFYPEPSEFDESMEALKNKLRESVKSEVLEELKALRTQNAQLRERQANLRSLELATERAERECERKARMAEDQAQRDANRLKANELLAVLSNPKYRVATTRDEVEKCDKCDENRNVRYLTPRGREATERCECAMTSLRYIVEENIVHEAANRNGKLLFWYSPTRRYLSTDDEGYFNVEVLREPVAIEEMMNDYRRYGFDTEEAAQELVDALQKEHDNEPKEAKFA